MFQLNFIYFSLALAIGTQFLNYLFMKIINDFTIYLTSSFLYKQ